MTQQQLQLCEGLKRLGFRKTNQLNLYGEKLAVLSDPIITDESAFVDIEDKRSKQIRRVPIPLTIVNMARPKPGHAV